MPRLASSSPPSPGGRSTARNTFASTASMPAARVLSLDASPAGAVENGPRQVPTSPARRRKPSSVVGSSAALTASWSLMSRLAFLPVRTGRAHADAGDRGCTAGRRGRRCSSGAISCRPGSGSAACARSVRAGWRERRRRAGARTFFLVPAGGHGAVGGAVQSHTKAPDDYPAQALNEGRPNSRRGDCCLGPELPRDPAPRQQGPHSLSHRPQVVQR